MSSELQALPQPGAPPPESAPRAPEETSLRGKDINGFEIISKVGQGGMGAVYKARQKSLDRVVALKILPPNIAKNQRFIERFQREARASAKLMHSNIVQGIDVGKDPKSGLWYFAMEFVDGPTLRQVLKKDLFIPEDRALGIARQIAGALDCVAASQMVHRDIKPDNIILNERGDAKLADLGLARQVVEDSALTQAGQAVGTPFYMAPEQVRGAEDEIDIRTDLYALGATLFHLVTGQPPFSGSTSAVVLSKQLTETPPLAHKVNPAVSQPCGRMIAKLMEKKREQRFQTPRELIEQIERILDNDKATTGPRAPISKASSGIRSGARSGVNAAARTGTGIRNAVGSISTGPRTPVTTSLRTPVRGTTPAPLAEDRSASTGASARVRKPAAPKLLWPGVGAGVAALVLVAILSSGGQKPHSESVATQPPQQQPAPVISPLRQAEQTQAEVKTAAVSPRESLAREVLDSALAVQAAAPGDFVALLPALERACDLAKNSTLAREAEEQRSGAQARWTAAIEAALKPAAADAARLAAASDFAAAARALNDDVIPQDMRVNDWRSRLEAARKPVHDGAEAQAAKILAEARGRAQTQDIPNLEAAIEQLKGLAGIPAELAPSAAAAAQERAAWTAAIEELRRGQELARRQRIEKSRAAVAAIRAELAPLLQQNKFAAALELLEKKLRDRALADAEDVLKQDKADIAAVVAFRQHAIDALRKTPGRSIKLKKGNTAITGTIKDEAARPGITVKLADGPEFTIPAEQLDCADADAHAPADQAAPAEDQRRRGLLFLCGGVISKAKEHFVKARDAGLGDAIAPYLERIEALELGEIEMQARRDWNDAETHFTARRWKDASSAYGAFKTQHAATKAYAQNAATLADRLKTLDEILNPLRPGLFTAVYRGMDLGGSPLLARVDPQIDFDWGGGSPAKDVPPEGFSIRFAGFLKAPKAGQYTFTTLSDDGVRVWIGGKLIIDQWTNHPPTRHSGNLDLAAGPHDFKLEFFENSGGATIRLYWSLAGGFPECTVPAESFLHDAKKIPPASTDVAKPQP